MSSPYGELLSALYKLPTLCSLQTALYDLLSALYELLSTTCSLPNKNALLPAGTRASVSRYHPACRRTDRPLHAHSPTGRWAAPLTPGQAEHPTCVSRLTSHVSRFTSYVSRFTSYVSRFRCRLRGELRWAFTWWALSHWPNLPVGCRAAYSSPSQPLTNYLKLSLRHTKCQGSEVK